MTMAKQIWCWYCSTDLQVTEDFYGDIRCPKCNVLNTIFNPADIQPTREEEMGKLGDVARLKSPYVKLEIGQSSEPMVYKAWKEVTNSFGMDSFRYTFEMQTESGMVTKALDVGSTSFAMQMDAIPFGAKVIVTRNQKLDAAGNEVEDKSVYSVMLAE